MPKSSAAIRATAEPLMPPSVVRPDDTAKTDSRMTETNWPQKLFTGLSAAAAVAAATIALLPGPAVDPAATSKPTDWSLLSKQWWAILRQTGNEFMTDRVLAVAAGVTFYSLLARFPAVSVLVSVYGLFTVKSQIGAQIGSLTAFLPAEILPMVTDQAARVVAQGDTRNFLALLAGLLIAIWSSNSGVKSIIEALNVAYGVAEARSFIRLNFISLLFTAGAIAGLLLLMAAIAVVPALLARFMIPPSLASLLWIGRWPVIFLGMLFAFAILYRFGPSLPQARWRWITPGSLLASSGLLVFSMLFSWYAASFGHYNQTYGTVGAAISFMTWAWLSSAIVLAGAELNAELDRRLGLTPLKGLFGFWR